MSAPSPPADHRLSWGLLAFLLAPAVAYGVGLAVSLYRQGMVTFEFVDVIAFYVVLAYLIGAVFAASTRKRAVSFAFLTVSSFLTLGAVEVAARMILPAVPGGMPRPPGAKQAGVVGPNKPGLTGTPYTYTINSFGVRGPEVPLRSADVRILCIGGSTTECLYVPDQKSWPWALQDKLAERLGKSVFVGSAGAGGHNTLHHEHQVLHYDLVPQFQWVVVLCGFNDMEIEESMVSTRIAEQALTATGQNKAFYRSWALARIVHRVHATLTTRHVVRQDADADWLDEERQERRKHLQLKTYRELPERLPQALAFYRANLKRIVEASRSRGVRLLFLTQPSLYRKDLPPETQDLLFMYSRGNGAGTPEYYERLLDAYNQLMRDVSREEGVDCMDLAAVLPRDTTVFYDDCHFNLAGCERVATLLTDFFAAKLSAGNP